MVWQVSFRPEVKQDFKELGTAETKAIRNVIEQRIINGEPEKVGKPLLGQLRGCRRLRTGQTRIVYRVKNEQIEVLIIAVGMRRNDEVYKKAVARIS